MLELGLEATRPRCARSNGRSWRCSRDTADGSRYCDEHRDQVRVRIPVKRDWRGTPGGTRYRLRSDRGYPHEEAEILSTRLHDPNEKCAICGVPAHVVWALWERGGPFATRHLPANNRLLTPDRIDVNGEHRLDNTRLACWPCNARRNRDQSTDTRVRLAVRAWWRKRAPKALRWWLEDGRVTS